MPNKSLGQHWLHDRSILELIADSVAIEPTDTVLEVGPGLGTLTSVLLARAERVIAVEYDEDLARKLPGQFPGKNLDVEQGDILAYDLRQLPKDYLVVANIPYYITAKIIEKLIHSRNAPKRAALLMQKEVAERVAAKPGAMSVLAVATQLYAEPQLGAEVLREHFTPAPEVDSQVLILHRRPKPIVAEGDEKLFFQIVKAGFSARRKKLRTSLAGGLRMQKVEVEQLLESAALSPDNRAQDLAINDWLRLMSAYREWQQTPL